MAVYKLRIEKWHPARLNEIMWCHWRTAANRKKKDAEMVILYSRNNGLIPLATNKRRVDLHITLAKGQKKGDKGNWWKSLEDALVHAKLLIDDNPTWYEQGEVTFDRGPERGTLIVLTDL